MLVIADISCDMKLLPLLPLVFVVQFLTAQSAYRLEKNQKSDVVYSGLENPITVEARGVSRQNLQLIPSFGEIKTDSSGNFLWKICHLDSSRATLIIKDLAKNKNLDTAVFKVKMIPPPVFELAKPPSGFPGHGEWRGGINAVLSNFPFDIKCEVIEYEVSYLPKNQDLITKVNKGGRFTGEVYELKQKAKPGDRYTFNKFQFQCGCDETVRRQYNEPIKIMIK